MYLSSPHSDPPSLGTVCEQVFLGWKVLWLRSPCFWWFLALYKAVPKTPLAWDPPPTQPMGSTCSPSELRAIDETGIPEPSISSWREHKRDAQCLSLIKKEPSLRPGKGRWGKGKWMTDRAWCVCVC